MSRWRGSPVGNSEAGEDRGGGLQDSAHRGGLDDVDVAVGGPGAACLCATCGGRDTVAVRLALASLR